MYKVPIIFLLFMLQSYAETNYYYKNNKKQTLALMPQNQRSLNAVQYYKNTKGIKLGVSHTILLKTTNKQWLIKYLQTNKLKLLKQLSPTLYLVENLSSINTLNVANILHENSNTLYAHPNFLKSKSMR